MDSSTDSNTNAGGQNLNDLQNYLVTFNKEIGSGDQTTFQHSSIHRITTEDGETHVYITTEPPEESSEASTENVSPEQFYSQQEAYSEDIEDVSSVSEMQTLSTVTDSVVATVAQPDTITTNVEQKILSIEGVDSSDQLSAVHAQIAELSGTQVTSVSGFQTAQELGTSTIAVTTGGDSDVKRIIRVVSVSGEEQMHIEEASLHIVADELSQQQIITGGTIETQPEPDDVEHVTVEHANQSLARQEGNDSTNHVAVLASVASNTSSAANHLHAVTVGQTEVHNAQLVALQNSADSSQPQLVAVQTGEGGHPETLQLLGSTENTETTNNSFILPSSAANYQTVTIMPSDSSSGGEVSYVLIVSQSDGDKDLSVYDFKEEAREITEEIVEEDGTTKHIVKIAPKKVMQASPTQLMCQYCNYTSPKRYLLTRHMKSHSEERPHKCDVCERGFKTMASLQNHRNTHTGTRPHKCKQCEAAFTTSGELVRHVRYRHTFEKPHKCTECDYASVELSKLKRHLRSHTGERPYQCNHCSYASPDTYKLKRHLRIHTGEKPYECNVCHARFTQSNSLKAHKLIHSGNKPVFQCDLCPTTCGRKTDLKIHIQKLHTSEKPLSCRKCSKAFPDRYTYKLHMKSHDGEKCFKCEQCDYAALSQRHLDSHVLTHTGEKPFECPECDQSFRQKQLLKRHRNLYHTPDYAPPMPKEKTHECSECEKSFAHKGNLMRHMNYHDPDGSPCKDSPEKMADGHVHLTAQQLLQSNLLNELREGKLGNGPLPQVVIVHPDGRVEEVTSKLQEVHAAEQAAQQAQQSMQDKNVDDILLAMEVTAEAINSSISADSINQSASQQIAAASCEPVNGESSHGRMKEASTQVELESESQSDESDGSDIEEEDFSQSPDSIVKAEIIGMIPNSRVSARQKDLIDETGAATEHLIDATGISVADVESQENIEDGDDEHSRDIEISHKRKRDLVEVEETTAKVHYTVNKSCS